MQLAHILKTFSYTLIISGLSAFYLSAQTTTDSAAVPVDTVQPIHPSHKTIRVASPFLVITYNGLAFFIIIQIP